MDSFVLGWKVLYMSAKSIWFITSINFTVSLFSFGFNNLFIGESGVLKYPSVIVWGSMYVLCFSKHFFLWMWEYMFRTKTFSWWIFPLMNMKCPSLSCLITFGWKSILLDIKLVSPTCFLEPFSWKPFYSLILWGSVSLCYWSVFLVCSKMLDQFFVSCLLAYIFLLL